VNSHLPNGDGALVEEKKIVEYLLNPVHPDGASKAKFFLARGFVGAQWAAMRTALQTQGSRNLVTKVTLHPWGARYQVDCHCPTPDGLNPCIRTIWEVAAVGAPPRLLTAHPLPA
jgi:hypothetical protein